MTLERVNQMIKFAEENDLLNKRDIQEWISFFLINPDEKLMEIFEHNLVQQSMNRIMSGGFSNKRNIRKFATGSLSKVFFIGKAQNNSIFLFPEEIKEMVLIHGKIGIGKTTFIRNLSKQVADSDVKTLVFDWKNEYRNFEEFSDFILMDPKDLKINPLGILEDARQNALDFCKIFSNVFSFQYGSFRILSQAVDLVYRNHNSYEDPLALRPSLFELLETVQYMKVPRTMTEFKDRVEGSIEHLIRFDSFLYDCSSGIPTDDLLQNNFIFVLDGITEQSSSLVAQSLMNQKFRHRQKEAKELGITNRELKDLNVFDEYERLFSKKIDEKLVNEEPVMHQLIEFGRAFGIGFIIGGHRPEDLTSAVKAAPSVSVNMLLVNSKDFHDVNFDFNQRQQKKSYRLMKGEAVVKIAGEEPILLTEIPRPN